MGFRVFKGFGHGCFAALGAYLLGMGWTGSIIIGAIPVACALMNIFVGQAFYWSSVFTIVAVLWWALPITKVTNAVLGETGAANIGTRLANIRDRVEIRLGIIPEKPIDPPPAKP